MNAGFLKNTSDVFLSIKNKKEKNDKTLTYKIIDDIRIISDV